MFIVSVGCSDKTYQFSRPLLGTIVNITVIGAEERAADAADAAFAEISRIEGLMSPYKQSSSLCNINKNADKRPVAVDSETFNVISRSLEVSYETEGAFDISFASISKLWDYSKNPFIPPALSVVKRRILLVNYKNIVLNFKAQSLILNQKGMQIGLGGIAKGYAIRRGLMMLQKSGIEGGIVEAGGDLQVLGKKNGKNWVTGLMHPRKRSLILSVTLRNGESIATSGDYERFADYNGKRYHHIIDPKTGFPAQGMISVSVISKDPVLSDAYATAFFVMGIKKTREFLRTHKDIYVILIDEDMKFYVSSEQKDKINSFENLSIEWI